MLNKFIVMLAFAVLALPAAADEIHLTPKNSFSGFNNRSSVRSTYPQLKKTLSASDLIEEQNENDIMKPKSVREMGNITPVNDGRTPMTYSQFPQNYDSTNSMMLMQGGMQNMFMGY